MAGFESNYTLPQREAAIHAHLNRGMSYRRVSLMARDGELTGEDGNTLDRFEVPSETVKTWVRRHREKQGGLIQTELSGMPHRDAVDRLRERLMNAAAKMLELEERKIVSGQGSAERLRQIIRAVREAAALPERKDEAPPRPGQGPMKDRKGKGGETSGGLAGAIMRDVRGGTPSSTGRSPEDREVPGTLDDQAEEPMPGPEVIAAARALAGALQGAAQAPATDD